MDDGNYSIRSSLGKPIRILAGATDQWEQNSGGSTSWRLFDYSVGRAILLGMYFFTYDEHTYWNSEPDYEDPDRFAFQGDAGLDIVLIDCYRSIPKGKSYESVNSDNCVYDCQDISSGGIAYVLLVNFTTGGTFGSHGAWVVAGVFASYEEANLCIKKAEGPQPDEGYRPWDGYFESLNSIKIVEMLVQD